MWRFNLYYIFFSKLYQVQCGDLYSGEVVKMELYFLEFTKVMYKILKMDGKQTLLLFEGYYGQM